VGRIVSISVSIVSFIMAIHRTKGTITVNTTTPLWLRIILQLFVLWHICQIKGVPGQNSKVITLDAILLDLDELDVYGCAPVPR